MTKFEENEEIGRNLFESFVSQLKKQTDWNPTAIKDCLDGFLQQDDIKVAVEIKTRNKCYEKYSTYWMELDKYLNIKNRIKGEHCKSVWYVNFFDNDSMYIFDFRNIIVSNLRIVNKLVLKSTVAPERGYQWKQFIELPRNYASYYKFEKTKWKKVS